MTDERGRLLGDRYEVQEPIGEGGAGVVHRAWDRRLRRTVAVKVLSDRVAGDPTAVPRLEREARAAAGLTSAHVVAVYDFGMDAGRPFLVMEHLPGGTLAERVAGRTPLPPARAADYGRQIAAGLAAAHARGLIHRDVTLRNVLVAADGTLKLTDFGIARAPGEPALTRTGLAMGTAIAMAPEQVLGEAVSPATDVYGLGVALYELAAGRQPFAGDSDVALAVQHLQAAPPAPREANPALPAWLEAVILRALAKDPADRYPDGAAMETALLAGLADGHPTAATVALDRDGPATTPLARSALVTVPLALGAAGVGAANSTTGPPTPTTPAWPVARRRAGPPRPALLLGGLALLLAIGALAGRAWLTPVSATGHPPALPGIDAPAPAVVVPTVRAAPAAAPALAAAPTVTATAITIPSPTPPRPTPTTPPPTPTARPPAVAPPAPKGKDDKDDKDDKKGRGNGRGAVEPPASIA